MIEYVDQTAYEYRNVFQFRITTKLTLDEIVNVDYRFYWIKWNVCSSFFWRSAQDDKLRTWWWLIDTTANVVSYKELISNMVPVMLQHDLKRLVFTIDIAVSRSHSAECDNDHIRASQIFHGHTQSLNRYASYHVERAKRMLDVWCVNRLRFPHSNINHLNIMSYGILWTRTYWEMCACTYREMSAFMVRSPCAVMNINLNMQQCSNTDWKLYNKQRMPWYFCIFVSVDNLSNSPWLYSPLLNIEIWDLRGWRRSSQIRRKFWLGIEWIAADIE